MKSKEVQQNIKLGIFVLAGLVLFFAAVFLVGSENNLFSSTFTTHAIFKNVEGLKEGDNVWLSGVKIGTVKQVRIVKEGRVVVTLNLKENQNRFIKKDATASIGSAGLVGRTGEPDSARHRARVRHDRHPGPHDESFHARSRQPRLH